MVKEWRGQVDETLVAGGNLLEKRVPQKRTDVLKWRRLARESFDASEEGSLVYVSTNVGVKKVVKPHDGRARVMFPGWSWFWTGIARGTVDEAASRFLRVVRNRLRSLEDKIGHVRRDGFHMTKSRGRILQHAREDVFRKGPKAFFLRKEFG